MGIFSRSRCVLLLVPPLSPMAPDDAVTGAPPLPTADDVRHVLGGVLDPELRASIVDLGMVKDVVVSPDGVVRVKVALTTAACPLRGQISTDVKSKVHGLPG